jgi:predicted LPLAT superfamily acyltransferase
MTLKSGDLAEDGHKADWIRHRERGSIALLRLMTRISLRLGRSLSRIPLHGIAVYFFLFAPTARRHSLRYLRLALGRFPRARDRFRQILTFATTIHDRVYLINGQHEQFNITLEGEALLIAQLESGRGAAAARRICGSFGGAQSWPTPAPLQVAMAVPENARKIKPPWRPSIRGTCPIPSHSAESTPCSSSPTGSNAARSSASSGTALWDANRFKL